MRATRIIVSFFLSMSVSAPAAASEFMSIDELQHSFAEGVSHDWTFEKLERTFSSVDDRAFLKNLRRRMSGKPIMQAKLRVEPGSNSVELTLGSGRKIKIKRLSYERALINGQIVKLKGLSARDSFRAITRILNGPLQVAETEGTSWFEQVAALVLPRAHAFEPISTGTAALVVAVSFGLGWGSKWLYVNWPKKQVPPNLSDILLDFKHHCKIESDDSKISYIQSRSYSVTLKDLRQNASKYIDADRLETVGQCGPQHVQHLSKVSGLEIAPNQVGDACDLLNRYLSCMKSYRSRSAPAVPVQSASLDDAAEGSR